MSAAFGSMLLEHNKMTPSPADDLMVMQSGLGKRTMSVTSDFTHADMFHRH